MSGNVAMSDNVEFLGDSVSNYYYLSGGINSKFFGIVDVPMSFSLSDNKFTKNLAMPFNRFSVAPNYKDYTLYAGYNAMTFSKYTMNGHDYLGGGLGYAGTGTWNVEAFFGRLKKAVSPDSSTSEAGYARIGGGVKIGYRTEKYEISANIIKIKDREKSVDFQLFPEQYVQPKDNFASSIAFTARPMANNFPCSKNIAWI
ncbi:MAG: hypothetical protein MJZ61_09625 [Bacteroidales bacterium]|nr:hypothetical protein [Bacteroidales bacterium]